LDWKSKISTALFEIGGMKNQAAFKLMAENIDIHLQTGWHDRPTYIQANEEELEPPNRSSSV
jgi:hypothetical protein